MNYNALNELKARSLGAGKHSDGQGLWLVKRSKTAGKWVLRLTVNGRRREMGLGAWPDVAIADARRRARDARQALRDGDDPIVERLKARSTRNQLTLEQAINGCFEARKAGLKRDGEAGRWMSPLKTHLIPRLGNIPIEKIDQHLLRETLDPIWHKKPDAAEKTLQRVNLTLKHAAALGLDVDLQAAIKTRALLGKQRHVVQHIPSMPYSESPTFYHWLTTKTGAAPLALRFLMLTVARTTEVRLAEFDEFDGATWALPPERTKTGKLHRIPLSRDALDILTTLRRTASGSHIFSSHRGKHLSDMAMSSFMKREGYNARPHGFRATFRSWAEECTDKPFEVKELSLGHQVGSEVERAYQRSDLLEARRELLEMWGDFLAGK
ncbi:site-specific integrase [Pseudoruegeria sp. HB172150]|uniref:tyrosine-type recombinase/integrase n=1 Tax=Pseudoruegeria sp. HB172150 TaxID=2721164 RepID=UPI0015533322|nr:site-specific integrase [Pseudoruegeria sp. HB172150]